MTTTLAPAPGGVQPGDGEQSPRHTPLGVALLALAAGLVLNTTLGPLVLDAIRYPFSETMRNQTIGLEAVSLALVAPMSLAAGLLVLRGHRAGPVLAIGPATYAAYMSAQYVVGPSYLYSPRVLPLHVALFVLSAAIAVSAWSVIRVADLPHLTAQGGRRHGLLAFAMAAFVVSRYIPTLVGSWSEAPLAAELTREPAMYWTIVLLDLGLVVPAAVATGIALRRGAGAGVKWLYALVAWFALVPPSVAAMSLAMVVNSDPHAAPAQTSVFVAVAVAFCTYGGRLSLHLFRHLRAPAPPTVRDVRP